MGKYHNKQFPGESAEYRAARDELLDMEMKLRRQVEAVAERRRQLPMGGPLKEDYVFVEGGRDLNDESSRIQTRLSELFDAGKDSLVLYSFMFAPEAAKPCPMCTSMLDSLNGSAPHITQRTNLAVVAKAPIERIREWARERGWNNLRLLSSSDNSYNQDYFGENDRGGQDPSLNVFHKNNGQISHFYHTELLFAPPDENQNMRHVDSIWPLWNVFDFTPEGRGDSWYPRVDYS